MPLYGPINTCSGMVERFWSENLIASRYEAYKTETSLNKSLVGLTNKERSIKATIWKLLKGF